MAEALGVRCVRRLKTRDELVEYVAWRCNVEWLLRTLKAIGGIGGGTTYLLDILGEEQDIIDDAPLTEAGVRYLRMKGYLKRAEGQE